MKIQQYRDKNKEWRWRLLASNGRNIANSGEGYKRKSSMAKTLRKIGLFFATASICLVTIVNAQTVTNNTVWPVQHYYGVSKTTRELVYLGTENPGMITGERATLLVSMFSAVYCTKTKLPDDIYVCWRNLPATPPMPFKPGTGPEWTLTK